MQFRIRYGIRQANYKEQLLPWWVKNKGELYLEHDFFMEVGATSDETYDKAKVYTTKHMKQEIQHNPDLSDFRDPNHIASDIFELEWKPLYVGGRHYSTLLAFQKARNDGKREWYFEVSW